jgi:hypothetical protein
MGRQTCGPGIDSPCVLFFGLRLSREAARALDGRADALLDGMQPVMGAAIGVWVAAIASAVIVIHQIEHPMRGTPASRATNELGATNVMPESTVEAVPVEETGDDSEDGVLILPMDFIIGRRPGSSAPEGTDVLIGPGIVTHPVDIDRGRATPPPP